MLCLRKITFIDRAEPEALWTYNLKKQWSYGDLIAVRVHDASERVLGSTIPVCLEAPKVAESQWGVSWIDADPFETPEPPVHDGDADTESTAVPHDAAEVNGDVAPPAAPQEVTPESVSAPSDPSNGVAGESPHPPPASVESSEIPGAPPADTAADAAANAGTDPSNGETPAAGAAPAVEEAPSAPTSPAQHAAPEAADNDASPDTQPESGVPANASPVDFSPSPPPQAPAAAERRPSFSSCFPINITQAAKGPLFFEVITGCGSKLAVAEANVQNILGRDVEGDPLVQHYASVLTPLSMKHKENRKDIVYAVLEFSVVVGSTDADAAVAMAASASYASMPTSLPAGETCAFSTNTLYFPSNFLTGTGEYIVTNVLCVESHSDNPVRLEVALPEGLKRVGVLPDKRAVISKRGGRAVFTFTWNVFDAYVDLDDAKDGDADHSAAGLHVLIRDGTENKAPVDIALVGDIPSSAAEGTGPFFFYVNHARVANIACSAADDAQLADILPISLVTRAGV